MFKDIDRIQLATDDPARVASAWQSLLDATLVRNDKIAALDAARTVLQIGSSEIELLAPLSSSGPIASQLEGGQGGPFAGGIAVESLDDFKALLNKKNIDATDLGEQLLIEPEATKIAGLRLVISELQTRKPVGLINNLYEFTHLTDNGERDAKRIADLFELDAGGFVPIRSENFGYDGVLTLFNPTRLHRIETIHPHDRQKTMGRYFERCGPTLYMCYAEADDLRPIRERVEKIAPKDWTGPRDEEHPDVIFLHPKALGGVMLGLSRLTHAWTWSGYPDRRQPAA